MNELMSGFTHDHLGVDRWINNPLANVTQTRYARFVRRPWGELKSGFTSTSSEWDKAMKRLGIGGPL